MELESLKDQTDDDLSLEVERLEALKASCTAPEMFAACVEAQVKVQEEQARRKA